MRTWKDPDDMLKDFDLPVLEAACAHGIIDHRYYQNPLGAFTCDSMSDPGLWLLLAECGYQQVRPDEASVPEGDFLWLRDRGGLFIKPGANSYPLDSFYATLSSSSELGRRGIYRVLWGHVNSAGAFYATEQPLALENERTMENMELLCVTWHDNGTIIITRPSWQDDVYGLDWKDDSGRAPVALDTARLYFDHPDSEQSLARVQPGERIAVKGVDVPAGMYRAGGGLALLPMVISNWGIERVRVVDEGITAIWSAHSVELGPTRLTGRALNRAQSSEFLYGAAVAAAQFGTPFVSPVVQFIKDGEYVIVSRNDGSKAWLEIAQ